MATTAAKRKATREGACWCCCWTRDGDDSSEKEGNKRRSLSLLSSDLQWGQWQQKKGKEEKELVVAVFRLATKTMAKGRQQDKVLVLAVSGLAMTREGKTCCCHTNSNSNVGKRKKTREGNTCCCCRTSNGNEGKRKQPGETTTTCRQYLPNITIVHN